jgi:hypothetical protein
MTTTIFVCTRTCNLQSLVVVHLVIGDWYLDCSCGFVPDVEKPLYNNLACYAREVIELEEEPEKNDNPAPTTNDKEVVPVKNKGKGKRAASTQVPTAAPATTIVGSPSANPSAPDHVVALSHSGVTISSVHRKRKAIAPDTSTTSLEKLSSFSLIEYVDMGDLIDDLMSTKVPPPAYRCIQEFLTKVCV